MTFSLYESASDYQILTRPKPISSYRSFRCELGEEKNSAGLARAIAVKFFASVSIWTGTYWILLLYPFHDTPSLTIAQALGLLDEAPSPNRSR